MSVKRGILGTRLVVETIVGWVLLIWYGLSTEVKVNILLKQQLLKMSHIIKKEQIKSRRDQVS